FRAAASARPLRYRPTAPPPDGARTARIRQDERMISKSSATWTADARQVLRAGPGFSLAEVDPDATPGYGGAKADGQADLAAGLEQLGEYQERLYAASRG